jgi:hypothetical protein
MRLLNFTLEEPNNTVAVRTLGLHWDLHNCAVFQGLGIASDGSAVLTWMVDESTPWGDPGNQFRGCQLRFRGVRQVLVTGRDPATSPSEDGTLADMSKVIPESGEYRQRVEWQQEEPFNLLLIFQNGLSIELAAAEAEFEPISRGAAA